ncbi:MAG: C45 family peptidase, partial [Pseudomonadota bacterium]
RSFFERGYSWQEVMRVGRKFSESIAEFDSTMLEELRGIAEGAQRDLGEIVALNARTELLYGVGADDADSVMELSGEGCTGAIVLGMATASGNTLHGQNWDWRGESSAFTLVLEIQPDEGPKVLTLVEAGTLARCGLNSMGIGVTGNFLKTELDLGRAGIPAPFIRRKVLMSSNFHDAMSAVIRSQRSFSINVMLGDGQGEGINFETTPERLFWVRPDRGILVHSNHFQNPAAQALYDDKGLHVAPDSLYRDARVRRTLEARINHITLDDLKDAFSDRFGDPYGVCRAPSVGPGGDESATLATVVMDLTAGEFCVAKNPYDGARFQEFNFETSNLQQEVS